MQPRNHLLDGQGHVHVTLRRFLIGNLNSLKYDRDFCPKTAIHSEWRDVYLSGIGKILRQDEEFEEVSPCILPARIKFSDSLWSVYRDSVSISYHISVDWTACYQPFSVTNLS